MASGKAAAGIDNTFRKTWDKAEYEEKAKEREKREGADDSALDARKRKRLERDPLHQGIIVARANLKSRDYQIDLASNLNRTTVHSVTAPLSQQAGFYCDVCDCVLKDSMAYLDHINGKWHNRALGMSMDVEKSTVDQVRKRLEEVKKRKKERGGAVAAEEKEAAHVPDGMNREVLKKQGEEVEGEGDGSSESEEGGGGGGGGGAMGMRVPISDGNELRLQEDDKEAANGDEDEEEDPDFAAMMGFGGFGGGKKS